MSNSDAVTIVIYAEREAADRLIGGRARWFEKHLSPDGEHLRWCSFCGDAWHGSYPCNCHESYMEDFPDMAVAISAWMLGGRPAVHALERDLLNGLVDRGLLPAGRPENPHTLGRPRDD